MAGGKLGDVTWASSGRIAIIQACKQQAILWVRGSREMRRSWRPRRTQSESEERDHKRERFAG